MRKQARNLTPDELKSDKIQAFIDDLIATMRHANGAGLAANQVGQPLQICAIEVSNNPRYPYKPSIPLTVLVNPQIVPVGERTFENYEGCLSVPNLRGVVERHCEIQLHALDRHGTPIQKNIVGLSAGTFQHEVDHLNGKLFVDRVRDPHTLCTWDQYREHQEEAFVANIKKLIAEYGS